MAAFKSNISFMTNSRHLGYGRDNSNGMLDAKEEACDFSTTKADCLVLLQHAPYKSSTCEALGYMTNLFQPSSCCLSMYPPPRHLPLFHPIFVDCLQEKRDCRRRRTTL